MFIRSLRLGLGNKTPFQRLTMFKPMFRFAEATVDPYYILGVDKSTDYDQIKRVFYSLANEYHPDKNPSPDASRQFILIKQAFEAIKQQKGMSIAQNLQKGDQPQTQQSRRPNPQQYEGGYEQATFEQRNRDYRMESVKAPQSPEYDKFRKSFTTIDDINDIKIRVEQGVMKDSAERFGLEQFKAKMGVFRTNGLSYFLLVGVGLMFFFGLSNMLYSGHISFTTRKHLIESLKTQEGGQIQGNDDISESEYQELQKDPEYEAYKMRKMKEEETGYVQVSLEKQDPIFTPEGRTDVI